MTYKFYFSKNGGPESVIEPGWTDNHSLQKARDGERRFVKQQITQPFRLTKGNGYETVLAGTIEDEYTLRIVKVDESGNESAYHVGTFTKTDCEIDEDNGWILAKMVTKNNTEDYLADEATEYDLIELSTPKTRVNYYAYPMVQVYALGSPSVLNFQLGAASERSVEPIYGAVGPITTTLGFGNPVRLGYVVADPDIPFPIFGLYDGGTGVEPLDDFFSYENDSGVRIIGPIVDITEYRIFIDGIESGQGFLSPGGDYVDITIDVGIPTTWNFRFYFMRIVSRVLTREGLTYNGQLGTELDEFDQFAAGTNYTHSQPIESKLSPSFLTSPSNVGFGKYPGDLYSFSGQFIGRPVAGEGQIIQAIGQSQWADISWFTTISASIRASLIAGRQLINLADAFLIEDAMTSLLNAGSSGLSFEPAPEHSQLLFSATNPVTSDALIKYVIVPKSNILTLNYDTPAGKAVIKFTDFADLFKNIFQGEFSVADNRLILETETYYNNGGSYVQELGRTIDLTAAVFADGRSWSSDANRYTYDKQALPERMTFKWMDDASSPFVGDDIVMLSRYVQRGQLDERRIGRFSTDLPLALSSPGGFSEDGFFLLACREIDGQLFVVDEEVPNWGLLQNGVLSWPYLHDNYYRDNMPCQRVELNGFEVIANSTKPTKRQTLRSGGVPDGVEVGNRVTTGIDTGRVDEVSENMASGSLSLIVMHKTT